MKQTKMKAILCVKYGPPEVLRLGEVEIPTPKDNEVLIRVHAATVTAGDCEVRAFKIPPLFWLPLRLYFGIRKPRRKILGQELAGEIVSVGKAVKGFKEGDAIFATTGARLGAYAEYKCQRSTYGMAIKPSNMSYEEAATIPTGGLNALYFLKKGDIQPGEKVLINGAGGSIGTYSVQLAKSLGAEVTAVDRAGKLDMLRSIGADHVVDYTQEDFTKSGEHYDVIFDIVGTLSFPGIVKSLRQNGRYVSAYPTLSLLMQVLWTSLANRLLGRRAAKKIRTGMASERAEDFNALKELIEAGKLKAVIDKRYPLEELAEAHRYVEKGDKKGNVIIKVK